MAVIAHADMDAFYASVEQRDRPELRGKPIAVGYDGPRGVVAAASYEARRWGVRSGLATSVAKRRCPELIVLAPRMRHYASISAKVREIFYRYTPLVEPLALDEAYLDIGGSLRLFGSARAVAEGIRADVRRELGLPVSVGVGPGKLVAKIASRRAKPDGLLVVEESNAAEFIAPLPVREIWGVGPATEKALHDMGIATIGQLAAADPGRLEARLGRWGPLLHALARGEDLRTVECDRARKSYGEENTFPRDATSEEEIEATIQAHAETVAYRMRRDGVRGRTVTLKYRPSDRGGAFRLVTRSRTLERPTDDGSAIAAAAVELWRKQPKHPPLRLVGVQVSGLDRDRPVQLALFSDPEEERRKALNAALDEIIARFGPGAVRRGG
ncbi:MAG: DNA polymerase IV [Candidatus Dadabacteria bacterium]|nr:MAG: DNA polymerase IV [Candidatus Dadabacteria bacterium]